ncbi:MAG: hypothetical protein JWM66_1300, partial [Solirubrobacterales bacterium]|nr:hypothetical protein [Solirubrobacterales bacterium]
MLSGGRPLKRWRYVGVFDDRLMACAAIVQVGPVRQSFWALHLRGDGELRQRTRMLPRRRELQLGAATPAAGGDGAPGSGLLRLRDRGVALDLHLAEEAGVEVVCPNGDAHVWTRKQAGVAAHGTLALDGRPARTVRARAVIDDTAG